MSSSDVVPSTRHVVKRDREGAVLRRIGRAIFVARERARLTQEEAASLAEIDSKRWQRLEAGVVNPTIRTLLRIARVCEIDLFEMLVLVEEAHAPRSLRGRSAAPRGERADTLSAREK